MIQRFLNISSILMPGALVVSMVAGAGPRLPPPSVEGRPRPPVRPWRHRQEHRVRFALLRTAHLHGQGRGTGLNDLLHSRFRENTNRLFRKHGMTIVGFWQPLNPGRKTR
jgi:hypothetical protein